MDLWWIGLAAFFAAGLTLFSGFGLGTLLTPVFALFFPLVVNQKNARHADFFVDAWTFA